MSPDIALSCSIIPGQLLSLTYSLGCPGFNHLSPADQPTIELILVLRGETTGNNQQSLNLGVNQNGKADSGDTNYAFARGDNPCTVYLLAERATTACGMFKSAATVAV